MCAFFDMLGCHSAGIRHHVTLSMEQAPCDTVRVAWFPRAMARRLLVAMLRDPTGRGPLRVDGRRPVGDGMPLDREARPRPVLLSRGGEVSRFWGCL
jgi:hypothetical protein